MGTRHQQIVINKNGIRKLSQYGQWDGYPDGQGVEILRYLRNGDLKKYQENLEKIHLMTEIDLKLVEKSINWTIEYPYLSRDCGSDIHQMIEDGEVKFVRFIEDEKANSWCEGFYVIDFQKNTFESKYYNVKSNFNLDKLPTDEEYLDLMIEINDED